MVYLLNLEWVVICLVSELNRFSGITAEMLADVSTTLQEIQVSS